LKNVVSLPDHSQTQVYGIQQCAHLPKWLHNRRVGASLAGRELRKSFTGQTREAPATRDKPCLPPFRSDHRVSLVFPFVDGSTWVAPVPGGGWGVSTSLLVRGPETRPIEIAAVSCRWIITLPLY
jgi:hypothetical protein